MCPLQAFVSQRVPEFSASSCNSFLPSCYTKQQFCRPPCRRATASPPACPRLPNPLYFSKSGDSLLRKTIAPVGPRKPRSGQLFLKNSTEKPSKPKNLSLAMSNMACWIP
ncbi:hypothetical protein BVRB_005820 [Beta vulgaris subsp. vulgaris]|uniref:Uncharacterized protein n=1 Tax=Beta vulgaris subsp. vulgaris TaxID=3555 RepID=A0A0J8B6W3_BETVV|nr:hypothetical protein BVRB_005820 [Beta vulgaris subsp. vulgaris]